jgi:hypothetical protein
MGAEEERRGRHRDDESGEGEAPHLRAPAGPATWIQVLAPASFAPQRAQVLEALG